MSVCISWKVAATCGDEEDEPHARDEPTGRQTKTSKEALRLHPVSKRMGRITVIPPTLD
jgi:hypothetical protein